MPLGTLSEELQDIDYDRREPTAESLSDIYKEPFHDVWIAALRTLEYLDIPLESAQKNNGLILTQFVDVSAETLHNICSLNFIPQAIWTKGRYSLVIRITAGGDSLTEITVSTHVEGYESNATRGWHLCQANTTLAHKFLKLLEPRLIEGSTTP
jgi:hypothetical protein